MSREENLNTNIFNLDNKRMHSICKRGDNLLKKLVDGSDDSNDSISIKSLEDTEE